MQRYASSLILILILATVSFSQTVSVPLSHWAYDAVERWEIQGYIQTVFNNTKPFTRQEMAQYVSEVWQTYVKAPEKFSGVDVDQLYYLTHEFEEELQRDTRFQKSNQYELWRPRLYFLFRKTPLKFLNQLLYRNYRNFVSINHKEFNLYIDPILSYSSQQRMDEETGRYELIHISNGLNFYGNLGSYFGFYFDLTDNHLTDERWEGIKLPFEVWEESGWPYLTRRDNGKFEFDENVAYLSFSYKYFYLSYGREFNQWGVGHNGNLMLSTNSTVYDQIKFMVKYWRFKFTHLTAFLQYISPEGRVSIKSQPHIDQYWSGNRLELDVGKGIQIGLSEGVVYGDRSLQLGYLNPISFFKSVEHYYGDRDNGVLGVDFEWRMWPGAKIFGEWFIDDITTTKLGTKWYGNKFGYQAGTFLVNPLFFKNADLLAEYGRVKPYVYSHSYYDYNKYKHYDTVLGHYIGPNSDQIFLRFRQRFSKFLMAAIEYEHYRHGSNPADRNVGGDPDHPWESGDSPEVIFLDGVRKSQQTYGASVHYEIVRNLFLEFHYRRMKFEPQEWENLLSFRISLNFGYRDQRIRHIYPASY
ncbi:MAG: hypothetical protein JSW33_14650 [bacterium]|nr:MAG: hypothetical protein JSW33_14650 [bacterium]